MGFFNSTDRTNSINQNIRERWSVNITDWLPDEESFMSFSTFGGTSEQRGAVVCHAIARCFGKTGIIVLHNNDILENKLKHFPQLYPTVIEQNSETKACFIGGRELLYDPFSSMPIARVVETIYPDAYTDSHKTLCAEAFRRYLEILQRRKIHICMANIKRICNMSLDELECENMQGFTPSEIGSLIAVLSQNNVHLQIKADINNFAGQMEDRLWNSDGGSTGINIISAVYNKALLAIKIPSNSKTVMDYLASELNYLIDKGEEFVLVLDSLVIGPTKLRDLLAGNDSNNTYVLSGPSHMDMLSGLSGGGVDLPASVSKKIILFACQNANVARFYSDMVGNYQKIVESVSMGSRERESFSFHKEYQSSTSEVDYARIRPEELVNLGDGAVMISQNNQLHYGSDVFIARHFKY